jgi:DNA-binding winged helix-turn-helix (wHTH) protein
MRENGQVAVYQCGVHTISPATRRLHRDGQKVDIEAKVFDLILLLLENRERALGKQEVITALWGHRPITDAALSQLLHKARRALDDDGEQQSVIRTVYGRGLQWVAPVSVVDTEAAATPGDAPTDPPSEAAETAHAAQSQRKWWIVVGALALIGILSFWIAPRGMAPPAPPPPRLALLPIDNATGDASLDWTVRGLPGLVASLLGDRPDLNVVDPLQVARVWGFAPPKGRSHADHMRYVTGADVLVSGKLISLPGKIYQLTLHVDPGKGSTSDIVLSSSTPSALGIDAVSRLRHMLKLDPPVTSPFKDKPQDAYLAETFARGIDLAMHSDWQGAKPYFVVVNKGDAGFLPARLLLAKAQANTDELREADAGYATLLADARRLNKPALAARVLTDQVVQATNRHENTKALELATQAMASARQADDREILAGALLSAANINARQHHVDIALKQYEQASALIEKGPMRELQPRLYNTMAYIAKEKKDPAAAIAAARAELTADQALGKERSSMIASFNLAYALSRSDRPLDSLPLLAEVWNWGSQHHDDALQVAAGNLMTALLYDMGVYKEILPVIDITEQLASAQGNRYIQSQVLGLRAGDAYTNGEAKASLAICRKVSALIDPEQDPSTAISKLAVEAFVALSAEPSSLAGIRARVDHLVKQMPDPANVLVTQHLVHALAATAVGNRADARSAFEAAAALPHASRDFLHQVALQIALIGHDDDLAQSALRNFDPAGPDVTADTLRLYGAWAARRGDKAGQQRAEVCLADLRESALDELGKNSFNRERVTP